MKNVKIIAFLCMMLASGIAQAKEFYYEETFDNPADYEQGNDVPAGWLSEGTYRLTRQPASWLGITSHSGDYVFGTAGSFEENRNESFCTQAIKLKGGTECSVSFWLHAPGGTPAVVRKNEIRITAGLSPSDDGQTITVGTTDKVSVTDWTQYTFKFTPDADGEYYIRFSVNTTMTSCGTVAFDDITVEGQCPEEAGNMDMDELKAFYGNDISAGAEYTYTGEALVTHVCASLGKAWIQDATAAAVLNVGNDTKLRQGDKVTGIKCAVSEQDGVVTLKPDNTDEAAVVVSSGNTVTPQTVTASELADAPAGYVSRLIRINGMNVKDAEAGDVFEKGMAYTLTDGVTDITLELQDGCGLEEEEIPTEKINVTGISLAATKASIAPRSAEDVEREKAPVVHDTAQMPYSQSFDNENGDYDGTSSLPEGWQSTGTMPFVTANMTALPAPTGEYYMITGESSAIRDERAYTPFFDMKAGETYKVTFKLVMPGNSDYGDTRTCDLTLTAGRDQESASQTAELYSVKNQAFDTWRTAEAEFTPDVDGQYCFAFNLTSALNYTGPVAVDDVMISKKGELVRPTADFTYTSWFDIMTSDAVVFEGQKVKMKNLSKDATDYLWEISGAEPETSTEKDPEFSFAQPGSYNISMTAKNEKYSKTTYKTIKVSLMNGATENVGLMDYNVNDDKILSTYADIPRYSTEPTYDFVSGINHYYRRIAERFEMPENKELTLSTLSMWLAAYSRRIEYTPEERNHPFSISIYGETDGCLDETKLLGRKTSTVVDEFGEVGIGLEHSRPMGFDLTGNPIKVKGSFYIAFEFDDRMPIDSDDPNIVRSFVSFGMVQHKSGITTLYAKPVAGPEGFIPDGGWCPVDDISPEGAGCGLYMVLWGNIDDAQTVGEVAIGNDGKIIFAVRMSGDRLDISGTHAGDNIRIYDISGKLVKTARGEDTVTQVQLSDIKHGLYIVKTAEGTARFMR